MTGETYHSKHKGHHHGMMVAWHRQHTLKQHSTAPHRTITKNGESSLLELHEKRTQDSAHLQEMKDDFQRYPSPDGTPPSGVKFVRVRATRFELLKLKGTMDAPQTHNSKYKTSMCRDIIRPGRCPRGSRCNFAHSQEELDKFRKKRWPSQMSSGMNGSGESPIEIVRNGNTHGAIAAEPIAMLHPVNRIQKMPSRVSIIPESIIDDLKPEAGARRSSSFFSGKSNPHPLQIEGSEKLSGWSIGSGLDTSSEKSSETFSPLSYESYGSPQSSTINNYGSSWGKFDLLQQKSKESKRTSSNLYHLDSLSSSSTWPPSRDSSDVFSDKSLKPFPISFAGCDLEPSRRLSMGLQMNYSGVTQSSFEEASSDVGRYQEWSYTQQKKISAPPGLNLQHPQQQQPKQQQASIGTPIGAPKTNGSGAHYDAFDRAVSVDLETNCSIINVNVTIAAPVIVTLTFILACNSMVPPNCRINNSSHATTVTISYVKP
eukprot:gene9456-10444_t